MTTTDQQDAETAAILGVWKNRLHYPDTQLTDIPAGREILRASPERQRSFLIAALEWMEARRPAATHWMVLDRLSPLLRRALPLTHDDLLTLIRCAHTERNTRWSLTDHLPRLVDAYLAQHPRTPELERALADLVGSLEGYRYEAEQQRHLLKLKQLAGLPLSDVPLAVGDPWADAARAEIAAMPPDTRAAWVALLQHCAASSGSAPSAKWRKAAGPLVERVGQATLREATMRWLPLAERPRASPVVEAWGWERSVLLPHDRNVDVLRGVAWLCAERADREVARALASLAVAMYRKAPGVGPRSARLANACIWALGQLGGQDGLTQLARVKTRVRVPAAQKQIAAALSHAAEQAGLAPEDLEELLVPTYGLDPVGLRCETLGDTTVELAVEGGGAALRYLRADGRRLASAPKALREAHGEALKDLSAAAADIKAMLPAQRDRIEQLYLQRRSWPLATWRERYLDHPLVGVIARHLIWRFEGEGRSGAGMWHAGRIVGADGEPVEWLDDRTRVALWHPLDSTTDEALVWRAWLEAQELCQPFKQAYREIYLLTDAERATRLYSNRFAAHIIRQHQFNALCTGRGWKNQLRLMVDASYLPPHRLLPEWGLRAEYWVEAAGEALAAATNDTGTYLYLATDQVRFYPIDAAYNYAHASGGGYSAYTRPGEQAVPPLPLEELPPLVLSEILRDVDLFVGVASVGNDPTWGDGGVNGRYMDYWRRYAFGDLSETAKTRRSVLERIIPRLKIAGRCRLTERFLVVRGDIRTYKIHLGSGNILMEPNDQYLCIVPGTAGRDEARFVRFEGDGTLAIILSKALLLAEDAKITDPTITRQLR